MVDSVSSGYHNTEKRVENTMRSRVFLTKFEVRGNVTIETLSQVFDVNFSIETKTKVVNGEINGKNNSTKSHFPWLCFTVILPPIF